MKSLHKRGRAATLTTPSLLRGILLLSLPGLLLFNYSFLIKLDLLGDGSSARGEAIADNDADGASPRDDSASRNSNGGGSNPVSSYWWPSAEDGGGLLGKMNLVQNPSDCSSPSTKFLVWRSMRKNEGDTRGLTAWGHAGASHLLHALTSGDKFEEHGSRVLIADDKLWPMAKGCRHGPETRECYFEPLTRCTLSDVDDMTTADAGGSNVVVLEKNSAEYDRSVRTVYTSDTDLWFRVTRNKYAWTGLPGGMRDHSAIEVMAAALAYYFRPREWLRKEIDERIRASIPLDLDPMRTVGVPIRRSDKCMGHDIAGSAPGELDCPSLEKYMDGVKSFLEFDPLIENVIVTSEDSAACAEFLEMMRRELPRLRVIRNVGDVQQGTGSGNKVEAYVEEAANANVVASALTSMHLHLRARYLVITSKSTWTSTIAVFARVYGLASQIFVIDIGRNTNDFSSYARRGS
eukprot:CAMPEP_0172574408 /NCGR_PEP_ID=MMETSP1067-20121228/136689_1 /TAXON_ID=265564 ORGANISM="Thalassiosira punctigera, Strain Tpunct2005C2" /NCGR_SAMPLE_ID=MMETSP1067 /ASSEMBLY_ACC=CAM_ASM_000444 /LENGTH=461 /DNA_ID=CAMNT_0013367037 /DNA_START=152 /DNA_END=1537 /DNA_ORIENTATION=+